MIELRIRTAEHRQLVNVTREVTGAVAESGVRDGMCQVYVPHTTAAVVVNESADPAVPSDLARAYAATVPDIRFDHGEGNSDAHFLATVLGCQRLLPVVDGSLRLGRWQGVFLVELDGPRTRSLWVTVLASGAPEGGRP
jgi:secondary thiamine-phosphate synthase enzyme